MFKYLTALIIAGLLIYVALPVSLAQKTNINKPLAYAQGFDLTPTQAYKNYISAQANGDYKTFMQYVTNRIKNGKLKNADVEKHFGMLSMMTPKSINILSEQINGYSAVLKTTGTIFMGSKATGTVNLLKEEGKWKVDKEVWTSGSSDKYGKSKANYSFGVE